MNYYEHHIGDYAEATAHLSFVEDAAYSRLIRKYYATEKPLPADQKAVQRLVGARTKEEREAVVTVLEEFFTLSDDGWHNSRCDEEVDKFQSKQPNAEAKKESDRERQRRSRERRKALFDELRSHGVVAPWDATNEQLFSALSRVTSTASHKHVTQPVTRDNTATQTPDTKHQSKNTEQRIPDSEMGSSTDPSAPPAIPVNSATQRPDVDLAVAFRNLGVTITIANPALQEWHKRGLTIEQATEAVAIARMRKPEGNIPAAYMTGIVDEILNPPPLQQTGGKRSSEAAWWASDGATIAKGAELGLNARPGESMAEFKGRITAEIERRKSDQ